MTAPGQAMAPAASTTVRRYPRWRSVAVRIVVHAAALLVAIGCLAAYEHFRVGGRSTAAMTSLGAAGLFGFTPLRDVIHLLFGIEGRVMHLVHGIGMLALGALPFTGAVPGTPVLAHAAAAPFAIMGAAQALMHANRPRNAQEAVATQRFVASLPEIAQFASAKNLTSPDNALRAVRAMSDIIGKAQTLGETELAADPRFQSALQQASSRVGANLGLDAVDLALSKLAANPATASAVPQLRQRLALARQAVSGTAHRAGSAPTR